MHRLYQETTSIKNAITWLITATLCYSLLCAVPSYSLAGDDHSHDEQKSGEDKKFDAQATLFHHILNTHDWHITDLPGDIHITLPLPWIIYSKEKGLDIFMLTGHNEEEINAKAKTLGYIVEHEHIHALDENITVYDFSISKTPLQMLIVAILMVLIFGAVAKGCKRNKGGVPKGIQAVFEPLIEFVRDDIAAPNMNGKHMPFMPYLLTLFFFIWFANIFGLTPLNSNIAGNISITVTLALLSMVIININGTKDYWAHIFWFPGVPVIIRVFIMLPIELLGIFTKPFALAIRLFANIAGGHFMILSLVSLIFILAGVGGKLAGYSSSVLVVPFALFLMLIEVLVAALQAYVFTLLTAVFIGQAMASHEHEEAH